jgi:hypothetical protein
VISLIVKHAAIHKPPKYAYEYLLQSISYVDLEYDDDDDVEGLSISKYYNFIKTSFLDVAIGREGLTLSIGSISSLNICRNCVWY